MARTLHGTILEGADKGRPFCVTQYVGPSGPADRRRVEVLIGEVRALDLPLATWRAIVSATETEGEQ